MTAASVLTNKFLVRCGELWPDTVRLWRTNAGAGVGMSVVHQAIELIEAGVYKQAIALLRRPVTFGVTGGCDLTGFIVREGVWGQASQKIARFLGVEIKASKGDRISEVQAQFHDFVRQFGGFIVVVRTLDQGLADLQKYAGPGEK